jgi:hypothetical protein
VDKENDGRKDSRRILLPAKEETLTTDHDGSTRLSYLSFSLRVL